MVPIVSNGTNVKVEWYQQNYSECSQHKVVSSVPGYDWHEWNSIFSQQIDTDCKSNYHTTMSTTYPQESCNIKLTLIRSQRER
jgi:hypothetical protein